MKQLYLFLLLVKTSIVLSQPGSLDHSFGIFGIAMSPVISQLSYAHALAIQPDGKILVTGHMDVNGTFRIFVVRYLNDGTPDPSFPTVLTSIGNSGEYARAIAVQNDGKVVVGGHIAGNHSDLLVMRLDSTGSYDTTFGAGGIVITDFQNSSNDETNGLVIQPDGKIVIAGWSSINVNDVAVVRYNTDGSVDSTFGAAGRVSTDLGRVEEGHHIALQPDGKILVAGFASSSVTANDVAIFRYHSNGQPDTSFGINGVAMPVIAPDDDAAFAMALQPDGKIVAAGYVYTSFTYADNQVVRFDSTGNLDTSFNSTGVVVSNSTGNDNIASGVIVQPDGKIVITGRAFNQSTMDFLLSRFNSNGSIDPSFGNGGHVYTQVGIEDDFSLSSAMQADGKLVVVGYYTDGGIENFLVARYLNDSIISTVSENKYNGIALYPLPASGLLHVQLNEKITGAATAYIYSVTAELLKTVSASEKFSVNTAGLPPGIYFLQITGAENKFIGARRFLVE
jgi:uncharacterized delta-60 repeat protein